MKIIMDELVKRLYAFGLAASLAFISVSATPNLSSAQEAFGPLAKWLELDTVSHSSKFPLSNYNCTGENSRIGIPQPIKIGASYRFTEEHPNFFDWTAFLINNPSEAVAKREVYAVDVKQLTAEHWEDIVAQAASASNASLRLSVIMNTQHGYVGTPIRWDQGATDAIASRLRSSENAGFKQNEPVVAYASGIVANSLTSFSNGQNKFVADAVGHALATFYACDQSASANVSPKNTDFYIGLSFQPRLENVVIQPLITKSGVGGERLGSEVPSWPYADPLGG